MCPLGALFRCLKGLRAILRQTGIGKPGLLRRGANEWKLYSPIGVQSDVGNLIY